MPCRWQGGYFSYLRLQIFEQQDEKSDDTATEMKDVLGWLLCKKSVAVGLKRKTGIQADAMDSIASRENERRLEKENWHPGRRDGRHIE